MGERVMNKTTTSSNASELRRQEARGDQRRWQRAIAEARATLGQREEVQAWRRRRESAVQNRAQI